VILVAKFEISAFYFDNVFKVKNVGKTKTLKRTDVIKTSPTFHRRTRATRCIRTVALHTNIDV